MSVEKIKNTLNSLLANNEIKKAKILLEEHSKELFLLDPIEIVNNHLFVLLELGEYELCYEVLEKYKEYPYQNMEVEEHLMVLTDSLPNMIKKAIETKNKERNLDENGVDFSKFHSKNEHDLEAFILQIYSSKKYKEYESEIKLLLSKKVSDHITFMCLIMLFEINSNQLVDFQYKNSSFSVMLNEIHFPFSNDDIEYHKIKKELNSSIKDVSISKLSIDLLNLLRINFFPKYFDKNDIEFITCALVIVAKKMFGQPVIQMKNERVEFFINLLEKISNS